MLLTSTYSVYTYVNVYDVCLCMYVRYVCVCVCTYTSLIIVGVVYNQVRLRFSSHTPPNVPVDIWVPAVTVSTQVMLLKITLW